MTTAAANLWPTPKARSSRLEVSHAPAGSDTQILAHETQTPPASESASTHSGSAHSASASVHSALSGRNLSSLFVRRNSLSGRQAKSVRSGRSASKSVRSGQSASSGLVEDDLEMMPLPRGKKRIVQEHHEARIDRRKADAVVAKWRVGHMPWTWNAV